MHRAALALIACSAEVYAHPGHAALASHWHGYEQALLIVVAIGLLVLALRK